MGVVEIMDMAGVDVTYNALLALHQMTGEDRYAPPSLLKKYVDENRLGRKDRKRILLLRINNSEFLNNKHQMPN